MSLADSIECPFNQKREFIKLSISRKFFKKNNLKLRMKKEK